MEFWIVYWGYQGFQEIQTSAFDEWSFHRRHQQRHWKTFSAHSCLTELRGFSFCWDGARERLIFQYRVESLIWFGCSWLRKQAPKNKQLECMCVPPRQEKSKFELRKHKSDFYFVRACPDTHYYCRYSWSGSSLHEFVWRIVSHNRLKYVFEIWCLEVQCELR